MKNIYNLLTDAFKAAGLDEQNYVIKVEMSYKVTIYHKYDGGRLYIFMGTYNDELFSVECLNLLLDQLSLDLFMTVIENQIVILTPPARPQIGNIDLVEPLE